MSDQTNLQVRSSADRALLQDSLAALKAVTSVRRTFLLLLLLSLLVPLAVFAGVKTDRIRAVSAATASPELPAEVAASPDAGLWFQRAERAMAFAPFVARLMTLLLLIAYLMGTNVSLAGRLGGAQHSVAAFFWAVLLMLFLVPWHSWLGGNDFPLVFFDLHELLSEDQRLSGDWPVTVAYYSRFVVVPVLGLLAAVVADSRFGKCYEEAVRRVRQQLDISVH